MTSERTLTFDRLAWHFCGLDAARRIARRERIACSERVGKSRPIVWATSELKPAHAPEIILTRLRRAKFAPGFPLYAIGIDRTALTPWPKLALEAGIRPPQAQLLERYAKAAGYSAAAAWWGSTRPIRIADQVAAVLVLEDAGEGDWRDAIVDGAWTLEV